MKNIISLTLTLQQPKQVTDTTFTVLKYLPFLYKNPQKRKQSDSTPEQTLIQSRKISWVKPECPEIFSIRSVKHSRTNRIRFEFKTKSKLKTHLSISNAHQNHTQEIKNSYMYRLIRNRDGSIRTSIRIPDPPTFHSIFRSPNLQPENDGSSLALQPMKTSTFGTKSSVYLSKKRSSNLKTNWLSKPMAFLWVYQQTLC